MTHDLAATADTIVRILTRHGVSVDVRASGLSGSHYITAGDLRIRVSDHVARPTYEAINGRADIEIGSHDTARTDSAVIGAARVLDRLGIAHDRYLRAALGRISAATARAQEENTVRAAAAADRDAAHSSAMSEFLTWAGERWEAAGRIESAKSRKRARQALKTKFRAARPDLADKI